MKKSIQHLAMVCLCLIGSFSGLAEETYETLRIGTNTFNNVRVIQASPVDLLIGHDEGYKRVPLQDLPDSLKTKYPYNAQKAADYEKEKAEEALARRTQNASAIRDSLLRKEQEIRAKIEPIEKEMNRLKWNINTVDKKKKGKGTKSADRKEADALRNQKLALRDQLWKLRDELQKTEETRKKYEP